MIRTFSGLLLALITVTCQVARSESSDGLVIKLPNKFTVEASISRGSAIRVVGVASCLTGLFLASRGIAALCDSSDNTQQQSIAAKPIRSKKIQGASLLGAGTILSALGLLGILKSESI